MSNIKIDLSKKTNSVKVMHAVNNGPVKSRNDQTSGNLLSYKAARIPYARNHDAAFCASYGGEHAVDVNNIFPNFDADPYDEKNYDFVLTDKYTLDTLEAGTETYYRLGSKIEHWIKKYNTLPPKDFKKWAVICEHIIRHYNEGWANGYELGIKYWEIWNEPDLDRDDSQNKRCWGATAKEFYELYVITAKHLKACFPDLKIGGPALAGPSHTDWIEGFFQRLTSEKERVPLDFFSWHVYSCTVEKILNYSKIIKDNLIKYGYNEAESILNEWNYVKGWSEEFVYSLETIGNMKGAAFTASVMTACQNSGIVDMLMYYDARPCGFNGLFAPYTYKLLKTYYVFPMFADLYDLKNQADAKSDDSDIYCVAAKNGDKYAAMITYYTDDDNAESKSVTIDLGTDDAKVYILDNDRDCQLCDISFKNGKTVVELNPQTVLFIKNFR